MTAAPAGARHRGSMTRPLTAISMFLLGCAGRTAAPAAAPAALYFDGVRWWIASVVWQSESPELPIPATLLPPAAVSR